MPPPRRLGRGVPLLLAVAALASCSSLEGRTQPPARSDLPSPASVVHGRFVTTVSIDHGELVVQPPGTAKADLSLASAETMFRAADAVEGTFDFSVVGLGVVTLSPPGSTTPTTEPLFPESGNPPGPSSTVPMTTTPSVPSGTSPVRTTAAPPPPGVAGAAAATTSTSSAGGGGSSALPTYDARLAWVGMAWSPSCPGPGHGTTPASAPEHPAGTARYTVVLFDARTGRDAVTYTSSGPASCGGASLPPSLGVPAELVSVAWQPVGPASTAVQVSLPACASYRGWTQLPSTAGGGVEVVAAVPFDAGCAAPATTQTVDDVVPLGSGQGAVAHAPLGPVDAETTLAGGAG